MGLANLHFNLWPHLGAVLAASTVQLTINVLHACCQSIDHDKPASASSSKSSSSDAIIIIHQQPVRTLKSSISESQNMQISEWPVRDPNRMGQNKLSQWPQTILKLSARLIKRGPEISVTHKERPGDRFGKAKGTPVRVCCRIMDETPNGGDPADIFQTRPSSVVVGLHNPTGRVALSNKNHFALA